MSLPPTHETAPLRPCRSMAWGLLVVVLDLRINGVDLVLDPVGWAMMAVAAGRLARAFPGTAGFRVAQAAAVAALPVSLLESVGATGSLLVAAATVVTTAFVFAVCTSLMVVVPSRRVAANRIRWADLALAVVPLLFVERVEVSGDAGLLAAVVLLLVVAAFVVLVWFLVLLLGVGKMPGPAPAAPVAP